MTLTEDELARPLTAEEEARLRDDVRHDVAAVANHRPDWTPMEWTGPFVARLLATLAALRASPVADTAGIDAALFFEPCREFDKPFTCYTNDDTGLWCDSCRERRRVVLLADTAGIDAAPKPLCGCDHDEESHFPACLAPAPIKPHVEFASPLVIEGDTMRREPNYICGCPAFGSPAGASLGKRRAKNAAALRTPKPEG